MDEELALRGRAGKRKQCERKTKTSTVVRFIMQIDFVSKTPCFHKTNFDQTSDSKVPANAINFSPHLSSENTARINVINCAIYKKKKYDEISNWRHSNRSTTVHNGDTRLGIHANAIDSHGHMRIAFIFRGPFFTIATIMRKCIIFHTRRGRPNRPNDIDKNPITMKGYKYTSHRRWAINRDAPAASHHVWACSCVCVSQTCLAKLATARRETITQRAAVDNRTRTHTRDGNDSVADFFSQAFFGNIFMKP